MAHSKVRWISTPTFLACVGGAHDREEGANGRGRGGRTSWGGVCAPSPAYAPHSLPYAPLYHRMCPSDRHMRPTICRMRPLRKHMRPSDMRMRPSASVCAPQPAVYAWSNPDHPTWQRCGSHREQSKSKFTLFKVNKTLTLIGRTRTLSDVTNGRTDETDGRTHRQPWLRCHTTPNSVFIFL
jgi:hypothetical protein